MESTPEEYAERLVEIFREVRRVLRPNGTVWLVLGDSYFGRWGAGRQAGAGNQWLTEFNSSLKPKDLIGIPWLVAFALRSDGWYLRSDIIWAKPDPTPESMKDRPTHAHEYVFLLSKSPRYFYDWEAIAEPLKASTIRRYKSGWHGNEKRDWLEGKNQNNFSRYSGSERAKAATIRNKRSVWNVATKPFKAAHFATFPEDLIAPCILAGSQAGELILDPFIGSGTTAQVAKSLGRNCIGIDLKAEYLDLAQIRIDQPRRDERAA